MPITENTLPYMVNIIKMSGEGKFGFNYGAPALIKISKPSELCKQLCRCILCNAKHDARLQ